MNILIIDDDRSFAEILKESLEEIADLQVLHILDCYQSASNFFQTPQFQVIDCILLDLQFPLHENDPATSSRNGLLVLNDLRNVHAFKKIVIVMTNSTTISDGQTALAKGCDGYLMKSGTVGDSEKLIDELGNALSSEGTIESSDKHHIFWREHLSPKERYMLDLILQGTDWSEIAAVLNCKNAEAAMDCADRIFDKLLSQQGLGRVGPGDLRTRELALEIWKNKRGE